MFVQIDPKTIFILTNPSFPKHMALHELTETEERSIQKRLYLHVFTTALNGSNFLEHRFDSTWEQMCRLLAHFDPKGQTPLGFRITRSRLEVMNDFDTTPLEDLPSLEVSLNVALCLNDHLFGTAAKTQGTPVAFEPTLQEILIELELLEYDGTPTEALLLAAIDRFHSFDPNTGDLTPDAHSILENAARNAWDSATLYDKDYMKTHIESGTSIDAWFAEGWHLGSWLKDNEKLRFPDLLATHSALDWLMPSYIQKGLEQGHSGGAPKSPRA